MKKLLQIGANVISQCGFDINKLPRRSFLVLSFVGITQQSCARPQSTAVTYRFAQLSHIICMGQSIGSGDDAFPLVTIKDTGYGNYQFSRGVHTWREQDTSYCQSPWLRPDKDFNLVPIVAGERATSTGETMASGLVDTLKIVSCASNDVHFLFTFSGAGSKRLRDLDRDHDDTTDRRSARQTSGGFYKTTIDDVKRAKVQANLNGMSYEVAAITWVQGEKNNDGRLSDWSEQLDRSRFLEEYANDLIKLKNQLNSDVRLITKQTKNIPLFTYQTGVGKTSDFLNSTFYSGESQIIASDKDSEIFVVSPTYYMISAENSVNPMNGLWGNWIHLNGDSQRWLGAQFAKVIKRVLCDGEKWRPLRPLKAWASEDRRTIYVHYHVPRPPIVIDGDFLPLLPNSGFFIRGGPKVFSVVVHSPNVLELRLESPLPAGKYSIDYASEHENSAVFELPTSIKFVRGGALGRMVSQVLR